MIIIHNKTVSNLSIYGHHVQIDLTLRVELNNTFYIEPPLKLCSWKSTKSFKSLHIKLHSPLNEQTNKSTLSAVKVANEFIFGLGTHEIFFLKFYSYSPKMVTEHLCSGWDAGL